MSYIDKVRGMINGVCGTKRIMRQAAFLRLSAMTKMYASWGYPVANVAADFIDWLNNQRHTPQERVVADVLEYYAVKFMGFGIRKEAVEILGRDSLPVPAPEDRKGWRIPADNRGNDEMVAYDLPESHTGSVATRMMKLGRLLSRAWEPYEDGAGRIHALVLFLGGEILPKWKAAVATLNNPAFEVLVDDCDGAFHYAYLHWKRFWNDVDCNDSNDFYSCMSEVEDAYVTDDLDNAIESQGNDGNDNMDYYTLTVNACRKQCRVAMLIGPYEDGVVCYARCLIWDVLMENGRTVRYADRTYGRTVAMKRLLIRKLYDNDDIDYNKVVGAGCSDAFNIEDGNLALANIEDLKKWVVPDINLCEDDNIAYADTFKYFDVRSGCLRIQGPHGRTNLDRTDNTFGDGYIGWCEECHAGFDLADSTEVEPGVYYCRACYQKLFKRCKCCGEHFRADELCEVDGRFVCTDCYGAWAMPCDCCGKVFLHDTGRGQSWHTHQHNGKRVMVCNECYQHSYLCNECDGMVYGHEHDANPDGLCAACRDNLDNEAAGMAEKGE